MIAVSQLKNISPGATYANLNLYTPFLNKGMEKYVWKNRIVVAAFLANVLHESGSFQYVQEIASGKAYEGRKDLGNIHPGDGEKYKGRGLIQITGRANYEEISKDFGVDFVNHPELLEQPEWAAISACWWWNKHNLNKIAATGDFIRVVKIINGGTNGLAERTTFYNRALKNIV